MEAKVYYQDFKLNSGIFCKEGLKLDAPNATFIVDIEFCLEKQAFVDGIFRMLNLHPVQTIGLSNRQRFKDAGHTSMSIGDYIQFKDGEIWICASTGWEVRI